MRRYLLWFSLAYLAGVAAVIWLATAVLCLGDVKFNSGCGGWEIYLPLWAAFYLPAAVAAATAGLLGYLPHRARVNVLAVCLGMLLGWLLLAWRTGMVDRLALPLHYLVLAAGFAAVRLGATWRLRRGRATRGSSVREA